MSAGPLGNTSLCGGLCESSLEPRGQSPQICKFFTPRKFETQVSSLFCSSVYVHLVFSTCAMAGWDRRLNQSCFKSCGLQHSITGLLARRAFSPIPPQHHGNRNAWDGARNLFFFLTFQVIQLCTLKFMEVQSKTLSPPLPTTTL